MALENIVGQFSEAYDQIVPGTMLHVDELQVARQIDPSLRKFSFHTADGIIYYFCDGIPFLAITRERDNLFLQHIDDASDQLVCTGNYRPSAEDVASALASPNTVHINLTSLHVEGDNTEWGYLTFSPNQYDALNPEERRLAERVHGSGSAFVATMNMLRDAEIEQTRLSVLRPEYVAEQTRQGAVVRVSWLSYINYYSTYDTVHYIHGGGILRGVPLPKAKQCREGDARN